MEIRDRFTLLVPRGGKFITAQFQEDTLCLWAVVDPAQGKTPREIEIFGTGHPMDDCPRDYIGTVQQPGGALVWHLFERLP